MSWHRALSPALALLAACTSCRSNGASGSRPPADGGADGAQAVTTTAAADAGAAAAAAARTGAAEAGTAETGGTADVSGGPVAGGVRWIGRVDASDPSAVKFAWSGTGFVATVSGTKLSVKLQTEGATSSAFFQPIVDGNPGARFQVPTGAAQTVVLADALPVGDHTVELVRESEGMYGDTVFSGFVDGTPHGAPPPSGRLIEIVGDSISAGYGNLGSEVHPPWDNTCTFSLDTESAYQSYGAMLGRALNAEVSIIARSGWGMVRDNTGNAGGVLSSVYANTLGTQAAPAWNFKRQADAVVIDLGTNDSAGGDPGAAYEDAYVSFLRTVRGHYPNAWVFLTMGPMTNDPMLTTMRTHLSNVVSALGDAKVTTVDMPVQDATSTGCDYHPNVAEDAAMAGVLATALKAKLGW